MKNRLFWLVAFVSIAVDLTTKYIIFRTIPCAEDGEALKAVVPIAQGILSFTCKYNEGAGFSLCSGDSCRWILPWLSMAVSLGLAIYGYRRTIPLIWERAGYGFILGGAFGNGVERVLFQKVLDFVQIFPETSLPILNAPFPIFNVADICINLGVICLLVSFLLNPNESPPDSRQQA